MTNSIQLKLLASPLEFRMQDRSKFAVGMTAINAGHQTIDPGLHMLRLFVNDEDSLVWADAIGNGHREGTWSALPAGESVSMTWEGMGDSLFPRPGSYILKLHLEKVESAPVAVHVLP